MPTPDPNPTNATLERAALALKKLADIYHHHDYGIAFKEAVDVVRSFKTEGENVAGGGR